MLGADAFHITDGGQVKFRVPFQQFALIGGKHRHLFWRQAYAKQLLRFADQFVHEQDYTRSKKLTTQYFEICGG